jgi:hypothetical protein
MLNRRTFLVASSVGYAGLKFGKPAAAQQPTQTDSPQRPAAAKSTILFFLCGGASHIDTWDLKPNAPDSYRGPFQPIRTTSADIQLCEHLPLTAKQAHHMALVHGVTDGGKATGDHHAGYYYHLTGKAPDNTFRTQGNDRRPYKDDWPFVGSVIGSVRPPHRSLPQVITLPHQPSRAPYTRPGQFAARLGVSHDPFCLKNNPEIPLKFMAPTLSVGSGLNAGRLSERATLRDSLDLARRELDSNPGIQAYDLQKQKALSLLSASGTADAFDLKQESQTTRQRYGETVNGMSLLMARRLVQAGVPFVTVFWKYDEGLKDKCKSAGSWDTHGNNFNCLKGNLLPEFDRCYSALLEDLSQHNLLDDTLVVVNSEMGRKPKIGDPRSGGISGAGRDHWTACQSVLLAGGGIRGGQVFGASDKFAEYPDQHPVTPSDIAKTIHHSMGIEEVIVEDNQGRPYDLLAEGKAIKELF